MLRNSEHEEYLARRARLGIVTPKPIVRVQKVEQTELPARAIKPYVAKETYLKDGVTGRVTDMPKTLTWRQIVAETALKYGQTVKAILGPNQVQQVSVARQECFYRMAKELGYGSTKIGRLLNNRDHSTVYKGIRRHMMRIQLEEGTVEPPTPNFGVAFRPHTYAALDSVARLKQLGKTYREIYEATGYTPSQAPSMYRRWLKIQEILKEQEA